MDIKNLLLEYKKQVDSQLEEYFQDKNQRYKNSPEFIQNFIKNISQFTLVGGKRIRAALIYFSYTLFSQKNLDEVKKISIFIELFQSFLLIHDDIMDKAELRRGDTTFHKRYEVIANEMKLNNDFHFGNTMGILGGDLACQFAYEIIQKSGFEDKLKSKLTRLVAKEIGDVVIGQIDDILLSYKTDFEEKEVMDIYKYKTAVYTFRLPVLAGAILAGAKESDLKILEDYAIPCGIAFQIRDDILGVFGEDETTGKSALSDIQEGKKTILVAHAYEKASEVEKEKLDEFLGKNDLIEDEADEVRAIFKSTGALKYSIAKCNEEIEEAKKSLQKLPDVNEHALEFLNGIADYIIVRDI
jgi:geranylgeranyl diphosphate synthase type I